MSGVLWLIVVLILGLIGLIVYIVVRKPKVTAPPVYGGMAPQPGYAPPQGYVAAPPPGYQGAPGPQPAYGAPQPAAVACRYCGSPVPPGSVVCPRCGGRL